MSTAANLSEPITPRLLTIPQAAVYCACAVWAIRQAIWSKELAAFTFGRRLVIPRELLDDYINRKLQESA